MRWVAGARGNPSPETISLYNKALICQTFPAYKLSDLDDDAPAVEVMRAMDLLSLARQAQAPAR